ncbi:AT-rich interactive domain-containing protein 5A isoform X2 [Anguilla anguilla]|nr:AT-rich interactive domain-containing protein 5A isoform X2 [Anguilla anguilla]
MEQWGAGEAGRVADSEPLLNQQTHEIELSHSTNAGEEGSRVGQPEEEEKSFVASLYSFMKDRGTPIERIPHLGFKQINLWRIFKAVEKLGGYDSVTAQRLWKNVYDELGGSPGSTSAATCTRRHYERLVLPFERQIRGEEDKPLPPAKPRKQYKKSMEGKSGKTEGKRKRSQLEGDGEGRSEQAQGKPGEASPCEAKDQPASACTVSQPTKSLFAGLHSSGGEVISPLEKKKRVAQASLSLSQAGSSPDQDSRGRPSVIHCAQSPGLPRSGRSRESSEGSTIPHSSSSSRSPSPCSVSSEDCPEKRPPYETYEDDYSCAAYYGIYMPNNCSISVKDSTAHLQHHRDSQQLGLSSAEDCPPAPGPEKVAPYQDDFTSAAYYGEVYKPESCSTSVKDSTAHLQHHRDSQQLGLSSAEDCPPAPGPEKVAPYQDDFTSAAYYGEVYKPESCSTSVKDSTAHLQHHRDSQQLGLSSAEDCPPAPGPEKVAPYQDDFTSAAYYGEVCKPESCSTSVKDSTAHLQHHRDSRQLGLSSAEDCPPAPGPEKVAPYQDDFTSTAYYGEVYKPESCSTSVKDSTAHLQHHRDSRQLGSSSAELVGGKGQTPDWSPGCRGENVPPALKTLPPTSSTSAEMGPKACWVPPQSSFTKVLPKSGEHLGHGSFQPGHKHHQSHKRLLPEDASVYAKKLQMVPPLHHREAKERSKLGLPKPLPTQHSLLHPQASLPISYLLPAYERTRLVSAHQLKGLSLHPLLPAHLAVPSQPGSMYRHVMTGTPYAFPYETLPRPRPYQIPFWHPQAGYAIAGLNPHYPNTKL